MRFERFLVAFLAVLIDILSCSGDDGHCVRVPKMCDRMISQKYTHMRLPNMLNHTRREDVIRDLALWSRLLTSPACNVGNQLKYFLCFTYAPVCVGGTKFVDKLIPPCKSMCQSVRSACEPVMRRHNYSWPSAFNCEQQDRFFDDATSLCISMKILANNPGSKKVDRRTRCSCKKAYSDQELRSFICKSDFVISGVMLKRPERKKLSSNSLETSLKLSNVFAVRSGYRNTITPKSSLQVVLSNKKPCRCRRLRATKRNGNSLRYLVIGRVRAGKLHADVVERWRAISHKLIRKTKQC